MSNAKLFDDTPFKKKIAAETKRTEAVGRAAMKAHAGKPFPDHAGLARFLAAGNDPRCYEKIRFSRCAKTDSAELPLSLLGHLYEENARGLVVTRIEWGADGDRKMRFACARLGIILPADFRPLDCRVNADHRGAPQGYLSFLWPASRGNLPVALRPIHSKRGSNEIMVDGLGRIRVSSIYCALAIAALGWPYSYPSTKRNSRYEGRDGLESMQLFK